MPKKDTELQVIDVEAVNENELLPKMVMGAEAMKKIHAEKMTFVKDVMRDGHDFGVIPGCGIKPSLWKPGAEKLLQVYGYGSKMERVTESPMGPAEVRYEVTYKCTIIHKATGKIMAECEGSVCSEEKGNWSRTPAKLKNTMRKMAQKRAFVGATLFATGCSDVFTQDIEDMPEQFGGKQVQHAHSTPAPLPAPILDPKVSDLHKAIADIVVEKAIPLEVIKKFIFNATRDPKAKLRNIHEQFVLEVIMEHIKEYITKEVEHDDHPSS